jgi:POT family proton-dependent oligopeptide transporter
MKVTAKAAIFGHPKGLIYLAFTEAFERFSFYGMQALLVLYMVHHLLTPDVAAGVMGLQAARATLEGAFGPLSNQAFASQVFGLYTGAFYLSAVIGGWIGDRLSGRGQAVAAGALLMTAGHWLMAIEAAFFWALAVLIVGGGLLKGNISAQVGGLYAPEDEGRRTSAFTIFNAFINFGAFAGTLACGYIGERLGWHYGFGVAGALMLAGLAVYIAGASSLRRQARRVRPDRPSTMLNAKERTAILALVVVLAIGLFQSIAYAQQYNVFPLWLEAQGPQSAFGFTIPVTWFLSLDPLVTILATPFLILLWSQRKFGGDAIDKIAIGSALTALSYLLLAAADGVFGGGSLVIVLLALAATALGSVFVWPATLALVSELAPERFVGIAMGFAFITGSISQFSSGFIGQFYGSMSPTTFWLLHAALSAIGIPATFACRSIVRRAAKRQAK